MPTSYAPILHVFDVKEVRTLALESLGGALEFHDFVIFVFLSAVTGSLRRAATVKSYRRLHV